MITINNEDMIDVEALKSLLLRRKTTRRRFKLPLTREQAETALLAAVQAEVEYRGHIYTDIASTIGCIAQAAEWITGGGKPGILLCGLPGNGKTTLARAIVSLVNIFDIPGENGGMLRAKFETARDICRFCKKDDAKYRVLTEAPLLVIDDMGEEPQEIIDYGMPLSPVSDMLLYRYDRQLATVATTNLVNRQLREKYGDRLADRFNEMMSVIVFKNPTFRQ